MKLSIVLDVCHNPQGMEGTLAELIPRLDQDEEIIILFGASKGKNIAGLFQTMTQHSQNKLGKIYAVTSEHSRLCDVA